MPRSRLRTVFLATTKGRILDRLRRGPQTVDELASVLGVTGNAIRLQLGALEGDGLIRRAGLRRTGARRPSHTYRLAEGADALFCQAYIPVLGELLDAAAEKMGGPAFDKLIRTVGRRLAGPRPSGTLAARVQAAAARIDDLGGVTEVKTRGNGGMTYLIHGVSCPLAAVVRSHPRLCASLESLVAETTRARARERCHRSADPPQCLIEVTARVSKASGSP